jgi:hypothetical protein
MRTPGVALTGREAEKPQDAVIVGLHGSSKTELNSGPRPPAAGLPQHAFDRVAHVIESKRLGDDACDLALQLLFRAVELADEA